MIYKVILNKEQLHQYNKIRYLILKVLIIIKNKKNKNQ